MHVASLRVELGNERWVLNSSVGSPAVSWSDAKLSARDLIFDTGKGGPGRISITGDLGRTAPAGDLSIKIENVPLQDLRPLFPSIAAYRGRLNATVTIGGTLSDPAIGAEARIDEGGVREFTFQSITGSGRWTGDSIPVICGSIRAPVYGSRLTERFHSICFRRPLQRSQSTSPSVRAPSSWRSSKG